MKERLDELQPRQFAHAVELEQHLPLFWDEVETVRLKFETLTGEILTYDTFRRVPELVGHVELRGPYTAQLYQKRKALVTSQQVAANVSKAAQGRPLLTLQSYPFTSLLPNLPGIAEQFVLWDPSVQIESPSHAIDFFGEYCLSKSLNLVQDSVGCCPAQHPSVPQLRHWHLVADISQWGARQIDLIPTI